MITIEEIEENVEEWSDRDEIENFLPDPIKSKYKEAIHDRGEETSIIKPKFIEKIISLFKDKLSEKEVPLLTNYTQICIQKYEKGEYIKPHTDNYEWQYLMILTDSELDGIVIEDKKNETLVFHQDEIGKVLKINRGTLHWVNPIRSDVRYSVVIMEDSGKIYNDTTPYISDYAPTLDSEGNLL